MKIVRILAAILLPLSALADLPKSIADAHSFRVTSLRRCGEVLSKVNPALTDSILRKLDAEGLGGIEDVLELASKKFSKEDASESKEGYRQSYRLQSILADVEFHLALHLFFTGQYNHRLGVEHYHAHLKEVLQRLVDTSLIALMSEERIKESTVPDLEIERQLEQTDFSIRVLRTTLIFSHLILDPKKFDVPPKPREELKSKSGYSYSREEYDEAWNPTKIKSWASYAGKGVGENLLKLESVLRDIGEDQVDLRLEALENFLLAERTAAHFLQVFRDYDFSGESNVRMVKTETAQAFKVSLKDAANADGLESFHQRARVAVEKSLKAINKYWVPKDDLTAN